jgi:phosphatidylcholine synthase
MVNHPAKQGSIRARPWPRRRAWLVHIYTASGAFLAFVAAWAIVHGSDRLALAALFTATVIDSTDGILARRARVKDVLPHIDGARIDDIVDYLTFVFLPLVLLEASGGLHLWVAFPVAFVVLVSSMYGFVSPDAKTGDHFFTGFPSYWNVVVLYLMAFRTSPGVNAAVLLALSALVFVRIGYVYPSRTPVLRALTLALGAAWGGALAVIIAMWPSAPRMLLVASLAFPVYYLVLSLILNARRRLPPEGRDLPPERRDLPPGRRDLPPGRRDLPPERRDLPPEGGIYR